MFPRLTYIFVQRSGFHRRKCLIAAFPRYRHTSDSPKFLDIRADTSRGADLVLRCTQSQMVARVCAVVMIVLAVCPITAPFATCSFADLLQGHTEKGGAAAWQAPVTGAPGDSEALTVPPLLSKVGHVPTVTIERVPATAPVTPELSTAPVIGCDLAIHRGPPPTLLVLRV